MRSLLRFLQTICFLAIVPVQCLNLMPNRKIADLDFYHKLLTEICLERSYESILLIHDIYPPEDERLELIYQYPVPKVILDGNTKIFYKKLFNIEILVVLIIHKELDAKMFEVIAGNLNYIRQIRIVIIAVNVQHNTKAFFTNHLMLLCRQHKMTNVVVHYLNTFNEAEELHYHLLQPYPEYHWAKHLSTDKHRVYFPIHWLNMHNITLVTLSDQISPRTLIFKDVQGKMHITGYIANLILLFAERFNVTLKMHPSFELGKIMHFTTINGLVAQNEVDLPMVMDAAGDDRWQNMSHAYDISEVVLMIPLADPLTIKEIFVLLLDGSFFKIVIICSLIFSIVHSLLLYFIYDDLQHLSFIVDSTAFPGTLGVSFVVRSPSLSSLKIIYFLIGLVGINISSMFAGHMNTYFTTPPYHAQIYTYEDLQHSHVKMLLNAPEANLMVGWFDGMEGSYINCTNTTFFLETRNKFNTSYAYYTGTPTWNLMARQQQFHSRKSFHIPPAVKFFKMLPWGFMLPFNSPHKEPLNYLILRVHSVGLREAWERRTFYDMLELKHITLRDPNPPKGRRVFSANDFFWVWMILMMGLGISGAAFVGELLWFRLRMAFNIDSNRGSY